MSGSGARTVHSGCEEMHRPLWLPQHVQGGPSWHDGLVTSWGPELGHRYTQPQGKKTWRDVQWRLLLRENIEREGRCTRHHMDTDMTWEHQHLGQQVLTWTVPGQGTGVCVGAARRLQRWTAAPSQGHFLLSKYRTLVSSHTSGAPSGSPLPFNSLR